MIHHNPEFRQSRRHGNSIIGTFNHKPENEFSFAEPIANEVSCGNGLIRKKIPRNPGEKFCVSYNVHPPRREEATENFGDISYSGTSCRSIFVVEPEVTTMLAICPKKDSVVEYAILPRTR